MDEARLDHCQQVFRSLLWRVRPLRLADAVNWCVNEVCRLADERADWNTALQTVYRRTRDEVVATLVGTGAAAVGPRHRRLIETIISPSPPAAGPDFHCDAALGGLARWLRAAGYEAAYWPGIDDDDLLRKMLGSPAILLTTDRRLCQRGVIASGAIAVLLISIARKKREQFTDAVAQLDLPLKSPRCMACGGSLRPVAKETVCNRIPPKTYPWRDDYYVCQCCDRLFWQGTHWQRIAAGLSLAASRGSSRIWPLKGAGPKQSD